jgi:hypothetical protein
MKFALAILVILPLAFAAEEKRLLLGKTVVLIYFVPYFNIGHNVCRRNGIRLAFIIIVLSYYLFL